MSFEHRLRFSEKKIASTKKIWLWKMFLIAFIWYTLRLNKMIGGPKFVELLNSASKENHSLETLYTVSSCAFSTISSINCLRVSRCGSFLRQSSSLGVSAHSSLHHSLGNIKDILRSCVPSSSSDNTILLSQSPLQINYSALWLNHSTLSSRFGVPNDIVVWILGSTQTAGGRHVTKAVPLSTNGIRVRG